MLEIDQDKLRMKFSALNVDFNGPSLDFLGSRKPVQKGIKEHQCKNVKSCPSHTAHRAALISVF